MTWLRGVDASRPRFKVRHFLKVVPLRYSCNVSLVHVRRYLVICADNEFLKICLDCAGAALSTRMPHPWAPGAAVVALSGRIASRRRLGSCLVFADLVPMDAPLLPQVFRTSSVGPAAIFMKHYMGVWISPWQTC